MAGNIMAIKSIGGFRLTCDVSNPTAVVTLRTRKHHPTKSLAVVLPLATGLPVDTAALMDFPATPIVLIAKT